jgi:hypothetical protein
MQFPKSLVFARRQTFLWFVCKITSGSTLRVVVAMSNVAFGKWRFYDDGILDGAPVAIPYRTLKNES